MKAELLYPNTPNEILEITLDEGDQALTDEEKKKVTYLGFAFESQVDERQTPEGYRYVFRRDSRNKTI